jgi:CHAT domain-containing protein/predicted negative regulator of RcsB-dependent stress response
VSIDTLNPGNSIERDLKKGETHLYRITLEAGQCFHAVLTQDGISLAVRISGIDDRTLAEASGIDRGERRVFFVSAAGGEYRLQVKASRSEPDQGHYELKIAPLRVATNEDRSRYAAQELFAEASHLGPFANVTNETRQKMIEKYQAALEAWRKLEDRKGETDALFALGEVNHYLDPHRSLENFNQALGVARAAGDRWSEELILEYLGETFGELGDIDREMNAFMQSLAIARELKDRGTEQLSLYAIAQAYLDLGEAQLALDYNNQILKITDAEHPSVLLLHSLCKNYLLLGDSQNALDYCRQAAEFWQANDRRSFEAAALSYIGNAHALLSEPHQELEYYNRALTIFREVADTQGVAIMQKEIGRVYQLQGDHQKALEHLGEARALFHAMSNPQYEAVSLRLLGEVYWSLGNNEKALEYFNQALLQQRALRDQSNEAATLLGIARSERDLGQLNEARGEIETSLGIVESLSAKVTSLDLRASYLSTKREYYEFYIDLLMRLDGRQPNAGYAALAFQAGERARARSLVESLMEARIDIHQGVAADLIAREHTIKQQIIFKTNRLTHLLSGKHSAEEVAAAQREIDALLGSYATVEADIRIKNPRYASLEQPQALSFQEVQSRLLDSDTLLLEYSLGDARSFVWAATPTSLTSFELPGRAVIEAAARGMYELLTARSETLPNESPAQKQIRVERADAEYPRAAAELSKMVLGPVASVLVSKRLLIVSEGALQYVPFGALPVPKDEGGWIKDEGVPRPLVVDHEIVSLPSASVLAALRTGLSGRQAAAKTLAVLADPVFNLDDPRIPASREKSSSRRQEQLLSADMLRSAEESGLTSFERLRFSRAEADAIARLAPEGGRLEAVDFVANHATATSADLGQYRIVHFATHGLVNSRHPELSGIVLSLVDQKGQQQNGFLRLFEIYNLKLNADLVVLSACQTALGKEIKGEGLIGLTRGFMYAGAPRVVSSLWRIDDRATAELMTRFYRGMLSDHLAPAAALRAAQVSLWQDKRWSAPHYWAAFTIQGEWK